MLVKTVRTQETLLHYLWYLDYLDGGDYCAILSFFSMFLRAEKMLSNKRYNCLIFE